MTDSAPPAPPVYKPLIFRTAAQEDDKALAREIVKDWLNYLCHRDFSISQWRKAGVFVLEGTNDQGIPHSVTLTFNKVLDHVIEKRNFNVEDFSIKDERFTPWPDASGSLSLQFYWANQATNWKPQRMFLGSKSIANFPLVPGVDREGIVFNPLHPHLVKMIIEARRRLVENSFSMLTFDTSWLHDLLSFFNFSVSLIEAWLTQVYYKAKYDPVPAGLKFDAQKMGNTYNRRLKDKLAWIGHVTGRPLENIDKEARIFTTLKEIRNHLNHFDPPVFAATIEDVAGWLNMIFGVASLLWKTRRHLLLPPDRAVIQLLFQERVEFVPQNPGIRRLPQTAGYASSKWSTSE